MKTLLAAEENLFPNVFNCILSAIIPLMQHNSAEGCAMQYVVEEFFAEWERIMNAYFVGEIPLER